MKIVLLAYLVLVSLSFAVAMAYVLAAGNCCSIIRFKAFFRWYDLWIGAYVDASNKAVYVVPIPMIGVRIFVED